MFKKGLSGNPTGKPPGAKKKTTRQLREVISGFLNDKFETIVGDFDKLPPKDRAKLYCDLLQYGLPKLQNIQMEREKSNDLPAPVIRVMIHNANNPPENEN